MQLDFILRLQQLYLSVVQGGPVAQSDDWKLQLLQPRMLHLRSRLLESVDFRLLAVLADLGPRPGGLPKELQFEPVLRLVDQRLQKLLIKLQYLLKFATVYCLQLLV